MPNSPYSSTQPMYCSSEDMARLYSDSVNKLQRTVMVNSSSLDIIDGENWSFDPRSLSIWNNRYWKGFYPRDHDLGNKVLHYGFGFYKRFWQDEDKQDENKIQGETHPFLSDIHAFNQATDAEYPELGKVVLIRYHDFPFNTFFDLMKIVSPDCILGNALLSTGKPPSGIHIFYFALCRKYHVDFMTQEDCKFIFTHKARIADASEALGTWDLRLLSDAAQSPPVLRLKFYMNRGRLMADLVLGGALPLGSSQASFNQELMLGLDPVGQLLRNEIRMVNERFMVGLLGDAGNPVFNVLKKARGFVMMHDSGPILPYTLQKVG